MNPTLLHGSSAWSRAKFWKVVARLAALGSTEPESTQVLAALSRRPAGPVAGLTLSRDASLYYAAPMTAAIPGARGAAAFLGGEG
jgi:hypothetical protein